MSSQFMDYSFIADWDDRPRPTPGSRVDYVHRALAVWPGLDRVRLRRANNDLMRIGRLVSGSTSTPLETILALLQDQG